MEKLSLPSSEPGSDITASCDATPSHEAVMSLLLGTPLIARSNSADHTLQLASLHHSLVVWPSHVFPSVHHSILLFSSSQLRNPHILRRSSPWLGCSCLFPWRQDQPLTQPYATMICWTATYQAPALLVLFMRTTKLPRCVARRTKKTYQTEKPNGSGRSVFATEESAQSRSRKDEPSQLRESGKVQTPPKTLFLQIPSPFLIEKESSPLKKKKDCFYEFSVQRSIERDVHTSRNRVE